MGIYSEITLTELVDDNKYGKIALTELVGNDVNKYSKIIIDEDILTVEVLKDEEEISHYIKYEKLIKRKHYDKCMYKIN